MKKIIKTIVPERFILWYHYLVALFATAYYGFPGKRMVVIGVTGTKGKTSASNFIWACLTAGGKRTGLLSTANIRIGERELLNERHMTMPGPLTIQRLMAEMVRAGCTVCIVETTSEGLKQYRHIGAYYDIAVFTNLFPEHLRSHGGSFEAYRKAKEKMFRALSSHRKILNGKPVEKVIIANADSEHASAFLQYPADKKITYGVRSQSAEYAARDIKEETDGVRFTVSGAPFRLAIPGIFNALNALPAIIIGRLLGVDDTAIACGLSALTVIPGRMEKIDVGQNFTVFVDYAHEKESMTRALEAVNAMKRAGARTIVLLGAEGGGRDTAKRPAMGERAGALADYVIVSNVDPYDDDPKTILEDIARASEQTGKVRERDLFVIEDRREGIAKAFALAKSGDTVLLTGKGAEQSMIIGEKRLAWDDRMVAREELAKLPAHR
ncbi:MAG: UDP-N-acetylmuramoyl-L-alanyl-D-glutamate--2,6-diaminopimelate ligase [Patescibacteria group bacterium]|nr:UDP-N-acetylmuramoyl-L-alanyl-D-glutamate--2,6-diaminopimelate ligase [Patescibacteria group bacterium]